MLVIVRSRFLITATRDAQSHTHVGGGHEVLGRKGCVPGCCSAPVAEKPTFTRTQGEVAASLSHSRSGNSLEG